MPLTRNAQARQFRTQEATVSLLAWIVLGLVAGFIASKIVNRSGQGFVLDIVLGIVGAVVGGWLFTTFGMVGVTGFNLYSLLVAVVGAALLLVVYHAIKRSTGETRSTTPR
jgi:uncharacterized membrane protein YeaQ/YmgE (transglycosylase-associated protein family)